MKLSGNIITRLVRAGVYTAITTMPLLVGATDQPQLETVVVTGARMEESLTVDTDPKAPRQPIPAHDGADYLKTIPGFSVIRKGGTDGDPVFRGMAGSRLSMIIDGESVLGGCGNRMDPPTAYVFPETFDNIKVIKGPQTVQHGPGNSAGVVLFERNRDRQEQTGFKAHASTVFGNFGRNDEVLDITGGTTDFYLRGTGTYARQGNYNDGDGTEVHSRYERWSANMAAGWTPDDDTLLEFTGGFSDGEAAYADRGMDGTKFARTNIGAKFEKDNLSEKWSRLEAQVFYSYVDHVMDNYNLREPSGMMATPSVSNPDRETMGGRIATTYWPSPELQLVAGIDAQTNEHSTRNSMNQTMMPYENMDRVKDASFRQFGGFGELSYFMTPQHRLIFGLRADDWRATDKRPEVAINMMMSMPNPTEGESSSATLVSGFGRYERDLSSIPATIYAGVGHTGRFPDYWELVSKETSDSISAFQAKPEKTTQLDVGMVYRAGRLSGSVSGYYNEINDFLLIETGVMKPSGMMGTRSATITRNVDARTYGLEADASFALTDYFSIDGSIAAVRGTNKTDDTPMAQIPPVETRLGLRYHTEKWTLGTLWRSVASQNRVDINKGNIVGQDIGPTDGFNIFSVNGSWKPTDYALITAGVDNLFDTTYAEHISRSGATIPGFDQIARVNEPGRTYWVKGQLSFN